MSARLLGVAIEAPTLESPCIVCARYPQGWAARIVLRGLVPLCSGHVDDLRTFIDARGGLTPVPTEGT